MPTYEKNESFLQKTYSFGESPGINFNKTFDLAAELETEYSIRKMGIGK